MRSSFAIPLLFAAWCFGQKSDRTFVFTNAPSVPGFQEIATVLRTVALIEPVTIDAGLSSVSIAGSSGEIALAEWMLHALDQPVMPDVTSKQIRDSAIHEYRVPGRKDDLVRMFYLSNMKTPQSVQELITVLRTVGSLRYVFQYTDAHALAVRGATDQIAFAAWMISELDQSPGTGTEGIHQFRSSDIGFPVVRAFYLVHRTPKDIQETLTSLRGTAHIQRAFANTARGVVIISGLAGQVDEASRIVAMRDRGVTP
jgi:hypothetical protein